MSFKFLAPSGGFKKQITLDDKPKDKMNGDGELEQDTGRSLLVSEYDREAYQTMPVTR